LINQLITVLRYNHIRYTVVILKAVPDRQLFLK